MDNKCYVVTEIKPWDYMDASIVTLEVFSDNKEALKYYAQLKNEIEELRDSGSDYRFYNRVTIGEREIHQGGKNG